MSMNSSTPAAAPERDEPIPGATIADMRLACTAGTPVVPASGASPWTAERLDEIGATGILLPDATLPDRLLRRAGRPAFVPFRKSNQQRFLDLCSGYMQEFGHPQKAQLNGPGLIAMLDDIRELPVFIAFKGQVNMILDAAQWKPHERAQMDETLDVPVVVRLRNPEDAYLPESVAAVRDGLIHGFITADPDALVNFEQQWNLKQFERTWVDEPVHCPHTMLEGTPELVEQFYRKGGRCDGYICTAPLTIDMSRAITNARFRGLFSFAPPDTISDTSVRVGIVDLQGASKPTRRIIDHVASKGCAQVSTRPLHRAMDFDDLDAVVWPGGWHGPQLKLYRAAGIIEATRHAINELGVSALFECAGAIAARQHGKIASGCSKQPPASLGDYGVNGNNQVTGRKSILVRFDDLGGWEEKAVHFLGAPVFEEVGPDWEVVAKTKTRSRTVGLRRIPGKPGMDGIVFASAFHGQVIMQQFIREVVNRKLRP